VSNDLYRMFDRAGRLLYVGISFNAGERATQHAESKPWWPQVDHIRIEHLTCSREDALRKERWAIYAEKPIHNVQHNTGRNEYTPRGASLVPFSTPDVLCATEEWHTFKRALYGLLTGLCRERDEPARLAERRKLLEGPTTSAVDFHNIDIVGLISAVTMACHHSVTCETCGDICVPDHVVARSPSTYMLDATCPRCGRRDDSEPIFIDVKDAA
jgi:hypothetical protein